MTTTVILTLFSTNKQIATATGRLVPSPPPKFLDIHEVCQRKQQCPAAADTKTSPFPLPKFVIILYSMRRIANTSHLTTSYLNQ